MKDKCTHCSALERQVDSLERAMKIRDTFLSGDAAAVGLQNIASFLDAHFTGREGRQMTPDEIIECIKSINSDYEDRVEENGRLRAQIVGRSTLKDEREHIVGDDGGTHIAWGDYPSTVV